MKLIIKRKKKVTLVRTTYKKHKNWPELIEIEEH